MLYSPDRGFVFVAVPKTGTSAIQKRLRELDPKLLINALPDGQGGTIRMHSHATVAEIRAKLGPRAEGLRFIAFMRDPRNVLRSKYQFYRGGRAARKADSHRAEGVASLIAQPSRLGRLARVRLARLIPFEFWVRVYPFKSSAHFLDAPAGRIAVDRLGRFEHLDQDFREIFSEFGYDPEDLVLSVVNATKYEIDPAEHALLERIAWHRLRRDMEIFDQLHEKDNAAHA